MSALSFLQRPEREGSTVGRDFAAPPATRGTKGGWLAPTLVGALFAGLLLATVRVQLIHLRYEVARQVAAEEALLEEKRELVARVRRLRDPMRLHQLAREVGLGRAERVIRLPAAGTTAP